jgi:signal transduction histidine kinase
VGHQEHRVLAPVTMESFAPVDNCPDAVDMVSYLQTLGEEIRTSLSRKLHDEMGGLLVSAVMDIGFAEQALLGDDPLRQRLARVRTTLAEAIDLKRRTIEFLRPSMLDNFGLFEAIKWEVKYRCGRAQLPCNEVYPDIEPEFTQDASIALFRVAQESLIVALRQPSVKVTHMNVAVDTNTLHLTVSHNGETRAQTHAPKDVFVICSIAHRVHALGGRMTVTSVSGGGSLYSTSLPLARLTVPRVPRTV